MRYNFNSPARVFRISAVEKRPLAWIVLATVKYNCKKELESTVLFVNQRYIRRRNYFVQP